MAKISEEVAEKIAKSGATVKETVISKLAEVEISSRVETITKAVSKLETLERDFKKINKNDSKTYVDGKPVEAMTENRFKEIEKSKKQIADLEAAINTALEKNDAESYTKLKNAIGGGNSNQQHLDKLAYLYKFDNDTNGAGNSGQE